MAYEVKLDVFQGPIDLLLHLITRQRVDIYEVSLARITDEYLVAVRGLQDVDLEAATGFLVVAATLLELKSLRLLPSSSTTEADPYLLEERDRLLARLVECATFHEAGRWIAVALERSELLHPRTATLEERFAELAPDPLAQISPEDVGRAAARVCAPKPRLELDTSHLAPITVSVRDAIVDIAGRLRTTTGVSFDALCEGSGRRIDVVVRFLALLELFKAGAVDLAQRERFGDIRATWTGEVELNEVIASADEYTVEVEA